MLTGELRQRIEERYLELANPVEFDGIRTQIAAELGAPKPVVSTLWLHMIRISPERQRRTKS